MAGGADDGEAVFCIELLAGWGGGQEDGEIEVLGLLGDPGEQHAAYSPALVCRGHDELGEEDMGSWAHDVVPDLGVLGANLGQDFFVPAGRDVEGSWRAVRIRAGALGDDDPFRFCNDVPSFGVANAHRALHGACAPGPKSAFHRLLSEGCAGGDGVDMMANWIVCIGIIPEIDRCLGVRLANRGELERHGQRWG